MKWNQIKTTQIKSIKRYEIKIMKPNQNVLQKTSLPDMSFRDMLLSIQMNHTGLLLLQLQSSLPQQQKRTKILHLY